MKPGFIKVVCNICILLVILVSFDLLVGWGGQKYMNWLNQYPIGIKNGLHPNMEYSPSS